MRWKTLAALATVAIALAGSFAAYELGLLPEPVRASIDAAIDTDKKPAVEKAKADNAPLAPSVTVAKAAIAPMVETALVTGTLVAREEVLVAPEVEGLSVLTLSADAGDRVEKGQLLATLESATLKAQLAQSDAAVDRAAAQIAQAKSQIAQADAAAKEAAAAFDRARPLNKDGIVSDAVRDQREAAARTTAAQLVAARDGLKVAEASKAEAEAQRSNIIWRIGKAEIRAPSAGLISRRTAQIGGLASAAAPALFRIVANGEIELEAEVTENALARIREGQKATVEVTGAGSVDAVVRLVTPEIDPATRLGKVRILLGSKPGLLVGAFGRGRVVTATSRNIALPATAVLYNDDGAYVQRIDGGHITAIAVRTGLRSDGLVEIVSGIAEGELVVAKSGTFLRDGDAVRPVLPDRKVSDATDHGAPKHEVRR